MATSLSAPESCSIGRHGRPLKMLFVPRPIENAEAPLLNTFAEAFDRRFAHYLPSRLSFDQGPFLDLKIPYVPYYAYFEKVAAA